MDERVKKVLKVVGALYAIALALNEPRMRRMRREREAMYSWRPQMPQMPVAPPQRSPQRFDDVPPTPPTRMPSAPAGPSARRPSPTAPAPSKLPLPPLNGADYNRGWLPGNATDYTQGALNKPLYQ